MHQVVRNGDHQGLLMGVCRMVGEPKLLTRWCGAASVFQRACPNFCVNGTDFN